MTVKKKFLDQKLVIEFCEFRALKNKIEKWLKAEREGILEKFDEGFLCPVGGPFLLVAEPGSRSGVDWKEEFFAKLRREYVDAGSAADVAEQLAVVKMSEIEKQTDRKEYVELAVKPNPAYAGKAIAAVVKKLDSRSQRGF